MECDSKYPTGRHGNIVACLLLSALPSLVTACAPPEQLSREATVERHAKAFTSTANTTLSGCTTVGNVDQKKRVRSALDVVATTLADPKFLSCLKDSVLSGGLWNWEANKLLGPTYAEHIYSRLRENVPTTVVCSSEQGGGCSAGPSADGSETITCRPNAIKGDERATDSANAIDLASLILHEVAHTKDYWHPGESPDYNAAVTGTVMDCLKNINNSGTAVGMFRALSSLPASLREAFVMKHVEGRSYEEMADLLGTTVGALKMRVHRAREALQALLEEKYA